MKKSSFYDKVIITIPVLYVIGVSVYMIWHRAWLSPDQFFAFALIAVIFLGRTRQFLWDWVPVLLLLFGYEYLRGLAPQLSGRPNIWPMISADRYLFGFLPTIKLQDVLFNSNKLHWYDYVSVILYISHFIIPMLTAFMFWLSDRKIFKQYTVAFLILSYAAFVTYIIYPAMPPWMASNLGFIPPLQKIMDQVMASFAHPISIPSVYRFFGANLVAAIPSIHAAYPLLIFMFALKKIGLYALTLLPYVLGVWFAVVYLGEHYVVDVFAGIIYALGSYGIVSIMEKRTNRSTLKGGGIT